MQKYLIISTYRAFVSFFFNTFAVDFIKASRIRNLNEIFSK
ncbi:hypothetical protein HMPREF0645_2137 [Hallella bergensis DSM 17361]|uniref:Uncharacterized protein n=1 Tax=Hallella bergensis DSM 17361 TaxID=585502 RepID=D1PYV2_9BACT|nr:hypothetical protein HMPREF0645_2137 [Hallella bergensis DSM 17361]